MELRSLRLFLAAAENASFSRAAERMHTVQSNVTSHVQKLEGELGAPLFDRRGRRVSLTWAGRRLQDYAVRLCALHDEGLAEIRSAARRPNGPLRLGSMETTAAVRLPGLLTEFCRAFPEVGLSLQTGPSAELEAGVLAGTLDAAFIAGDVDARLTAVPAYREELVLVGPGAEAPPRGGALGDCTLVVFRAGCSYRRQLERYLASNGGHRGRIMEFGTLDGILGCVAAGMGVTALPRSAVSRHRDRFRLSITALPKRFAAMATHLVYRAEAARAPALAAFVAGFEAGTDAGPRFDATHAIGHTALETT